MSKRIKKLIKKAVKEYGRITPCGNKKSLQSCFEYGLFWFNVTGGSTRCLRIPGEKIGW